MSSSRSQVGWVEAFLFLAGLAVMLTGVALHWQWMRLERLGVTVSGTIREKEVATDEDGGKHFRLHVEYPLEGAGGRKAMIRGEFTASKRLYDSVELDSPIAVRYMPASPRIAELEGALESFKHGAVAVTCLGGAMLLTGAGIGLVRLCRRRRPRP